MRRAASIELLVASASRFCYNASRARNTKQLFHDMHQADPGLLDDEDSRAAIGKEK